MVAGEAPLRELEHRAAPDPAAPGAGGGTAPGIPRPLPLVSRPRQRHARRPARPGSLPRGGGGARGNRFHPHALRARGDHRLRALGHPAVLAPAPRFPGERLRPRPVQDLERLRRHARLAHRSQRPARDPGRPGPRGRARPGLVRERSLARARPGWRRDR